MPKNPLAVTPKQSSISCTSSCTTSSASPSASPQPVSRGGTLTDEDPSGYRTLCASRRPAPPVRQRAIALGETTITYRHRISRRARRLRFEVRPGNGLEVTTPPGVSVARIEAVMREKTKWITTMLIRYAQPPASVVGASLECGTLLPFAGKQLQLCVAVQASGRRKGARIDDGKLYLTLSSSDPETLKSALEAWYRQQGRTIFTERAAHWNAYFRYSYGRIAIRDQKSRWGSCSRQGNLNFNWRLLLAPLEVLDYIVIHELAHLKEGNHSSRFWALVGEYCPDYLAQREWLRRHGPELHF